MKGEVLHYDDNVGTGLISGSDGNRYTFARADLKQLVPVGRGTKVDFDFDGKAAKDIFIDASAPAPSASVAQAPQAHAAAPAAAAAPPPKVGFFGHFPRFYTTNFAKFSGRARRQEFWSVLIINGVIFTILGGFVVWGTMDAMKRFRLNLNRPDLWEAANASQMSVIAGIILLALLVMSLVPGIALVFRRVHDIGWHGLMALVFIAIPIAVYLFAPLGFSERVMVTGFAATLVLLIVALFPGQAGENKQGPSPR